MGWLSYRSVRLFKRVLLPLAAVFYILWAFFNLHTRNIIRNSLVRTEPYNGGPIDDIKIIRCYIWYGSCNQIIEKNLVETDSGTHSYEEQTWLKVEKNVDLHGEPPGSWSFFHEYIYVRKCEKKRFNAPGRAIVDIAFGEPGSLQPPHYVVEDSKSLIGRPKSRVDVTKNFYSWDLKHGVIWVKYDKSTSTHTIQDLMILFGEDVIEPRKEWNLAAGTLRINTKHAIRLSLCRDRQKYLQTSQAVPKVYENKDNNEVKILQLSDIHFTENLGQCKDQMVDEAICNASPKTLNFIHQVLDEESPDLVVITGDILDGFNAYDYQTAILKALSPIIARSIPFAVALGENDKNQHASRIEIINFLTTLPFNTMTKHNKEDFGQVVNYAVPIHNAEDVVVDAIYIMDSEFTQDQAAKYLKPIYEEFTPKPKLSLEFQYYPIREYRPKTAFAIVGQYNEKGKLKAKTDQNTRKVLSEMNVQAISVGFEHTNECCIQNDGQSDGFQPLWLCFGGSVGAGAYGKHHRRVRLFRLNSKKNEITTWKRQQSEPHSVFDYQFIYN